MFVSTDEPLQYIAKMGQNTVFEVGAVASLALFNSDCL